MFSDESRFSLQSDSRRTLIWRVPGTRYHQENTIERHHHGGAGWLVWGGIILGTRTDLHVQSVTMTGHIYRDVILEQHVRLFRGAIGAEFLFMDDNARLHRANIVDECLQSDDSTRKVWPAYSPDFNPIEHVWDMLGRRIAARQHPPICLPELQRALLDEWCNIPQDQIDNLILSMPRRCKTYRLRKWVPHTLLEVHKQQRVAACLSLLFSHRRASIFNRVLTSDEKWVLFDTPKRSKHWLSPQDIVLHCSRPLMHPRKIMLCVWWTCRQMVHYELLPTGQTVTADLYSQQLEYIQQALHQKEPALVNRKLYVYCMITRRRMSRAWPGIRYSDLVGRLCVILLTHLTLHTIRLRPLPFPGQSSSW
ncbi:histone-lysine N-methyltransferase SETMAR [Trichonephila clavipes]|nr:histone-lysine N-methyltransferase SETMAR [Trichonephila clavipes]